MNNTQPQYVSVPLGTNSGSELWMWTSVVSLKLLMGREGGGGGGRMLLL